MSPILPDRVAGLLRHPAVLIAGTFVIGLLVGRGFLAPGGDHAHGPSGSAPAESVAEEAVVWTCSMHPQIQLPESGQCPICFMDLIPIEGGGGDDDGEAPRLEMSTAARALAEIRTTPVERDRPFVEVRLVGRLVTDETRISAITAWTAGRLDRLYVDYTGIRVREGDHLAEIYSPELLTAGEELVQALRTRDEMNGGSSAMLRRSADATVEATREKLRLLGVTPDQIAEIESGKSPSDHLTIYAPTGGVIVEKNALPGDYVKTGSVIYRIADLSKLWVFLDAHESDLAWIRYGQDVEFGVEALPGEAFHGRVAFIPPTMDPISRTVKVRVHVDNPDGRLKPEMFVRATILAETSGSGVVVAEDLAGKWICPMHPEIVKDGAAGCDVCGMDLVPAEELGYVIDENDGELPLLIPRSAVLFTGKRAIVYVAVPDADRPTFEGREIVLGPRAGDRYLVASGLAEGERVVVNGAFKIDSALQIQAKPSMMSPDGGVPGGGAHDHGAMDHGAMSGSAPAAPASHAPPAEFVASLGPVYTTYFALSEALASDDESTARSEFEQLAKKVGAIDASGLSSRGRRDWLDLSGQVADGAQRAGAGSGIGPVRTAFEAASEAMVAVERAFGHAGEGAHFVTFCPMAFDFDGAHWLQDRDAIRNPYFGARMLKCGEVRETIESAAAAPEGAGHEGHADPADHGDHADHGAVGGN